MPRLQTLAVETPFMRVSGKSVAFVSACRDGQ